MSETKRRPSLFVNLLFLLFGIAAILYYIAMGVIVRFNQSAAWVWPAAGAVCIARFLVVTYMRHTGRRPAWPRWLTVIFHVVLAIGFAWFFTIEAFVFSGSLVKAPAGLDYIIVLGGKVNGTEPSGVLLNRIEYAARYLNENPDCICIASGGKGDDEGISEAQCIYNGLVTRGIAPERILLEEKSTSTKENMLYSFDMIKDTTLSVGIVTNNFHMFRSLKYARTLFPERTIYGIVVHTTPLSYPHYMMREALANTVELLKKNYSLF